MFWGIIAKPVMMGCHMRSGAQVCIPIMVSGARLLAIHKSLEAFGAKEGLHLFTPGDIVGSSEGLDAMQVGLVF